MNAIFAIRRIVLLSLLAAAAGAQSEVNTATRAIVPEGSYNWRDAKTHALMTTIWSPANPPQPKLPLILLSHGSGGSAQMLAWLGELLAEHGFIAAAVNHPGNNSLEEYTVRGFTLWNQRATDITQVLNALLKDREFGARIDPARIGAAGFSLGGYTVVTLAGGVGSFDRFHTFCSSPSADAMCNPQAEFPGLNAEAGKLAQSDSAFRKELADAPTALADARIRAAFLLAPALAHAFSEDSLRHISIPFEIVAGKEDQVAPVATNAMFLARCIPLVRLSLLHNGTGHYTFLAVCPPSAVTPYCMDAPGVDRQAVHDDVAARALTFFSNHLLR